MSLRFDCYLDVNEDNFAEHNVSASIPRRFNFGLQTGNSAFSLQDTATISGDNGQTSIIAFETVERGYRANITYQAPLPVTRNTETAVSPTVRFYDNEPSKAVSLVNPSLMILTALDVGTYV